MTRRIRFSWHMGIAFFRFWCPVCGERGPGRFSYRALRADGAAHECERSSDQ